ncbi:MAG: hypothetical protein WCX79_03530 [Candidatus Paceibacterota bacterium]|jgi:phage FluMu protein Com
MNDKKIKEYRCSCGKLLFKGYLFIGTVEIKCRHCREIAYFLGRIRQEKNKELA